MPRRAKGPRLYERRRKGRPPVWTIRDGLDEITLGPISRGEADLELAAYLERKHRPAGPARAEELTVSQALTIYAEEHARSAGDPARIGYAILALESFWRDLTVADVKGATCRRYAKTRDRAPATIRRELSTLRAALNYCAREGYLLQAPLVWLPPKPAPRERWLTRDEAARLLRAARALDRRGRHLARFIIAGLYTGSRRDTILGLRLDQPSTEGGWIDTERGVIYRRAAGKAETKKRQPPARLSRRFLARCRRWAARGDRYVVQNHRGERIGSIKRAWASAREAAGLGPEVTPHTLRHTCATWLMQAGADKWDAAGFLGMTVDTLERVYGHHHPDHQESAVSALDRRGKA